MPGLAAAGLWSLVVATAATVAVAAQPGTVASPGDRDQAPAGAGGTEIAAHRFASSTDGGILFSDAGAGGADLYVINERGEGRRAIAVTSGLAEAQGDWSPDRGTVAYTAFVDSLWRLGLLDVATGQTAAISSGPEDFEPDWSPDGRRLLFTSYFNRNTLDQSSFIMSAAFDGSDAQPVIELRHPTHYIGNPRWSPDGARIAFTVGSSTDGGSLYVMAADGTGAHRMLEHSGWDDIDPAWSPDGRRIAFASGRNAGSTSATTHDIWLLDVEQAVAGTVIVEDELDLRRPAWSPDGRWLAFDSRAIRGSSGYSVHVAPALGGPVGTPIAAGREPDWAGVPVPTITPVDVTPSPTDPLTPTGEATGEATATPPDLTDVPPLPTLPTFPTFPPTAPTGTGPAPTFPPDTATPTGSPTTSPTVTPGATERRILLPAALRGATIGGGAPAAARQPLETRRVR
ncbi:MAG: TolB family protein [Anaerolineae bacterium]